MHPLRPMFWLPRGQCSLVVVELSYWTARSSALVDVWVIIFEMIVKGNLPGRSVHPYLESVLEQLEHTFRFTLGARMKNHVNQSFSVT